VDQQPLPVVYRLAAVNVERGQARFLKALVGVGPIAQQPVGCPLGCRTVPAQDFLPIWHERLPPPLLIFTIQSLQTRFFLQLDLDKAGAECDPRQPKASL
jgi:hypothetical protein